jgi:O-antigen ligase
MRERIEQIFTLENFKYFLLFALLLRYNVFYFSPEGYKFAKLAVYLVHGLGLAWGLALLFHRKFTGKPLVTIKPAWPYLVFIGSYLVTILTTEFPALSLLSGFFSYIVYFFVLTSYEAADSKQGIARQIKLLNNLFIGATFAITLVSILLFFADVDWRSSSIYVLIGNTGGRFSGLTGSPNKDAILAVLSLFSSFFNIYVFKLNRSTKILYASNFFAQTLLLAIGFSRGGPLVIVIMTLLISIAWFKEKIITKAKLSELLRIPLLAGVSILIFLSSLFVVQKSADKIKGYFHALPAITASNGEIPGGAEASLKLGRAENSEYSSGRIDLWKNCIPIVMKYPLGVGFSNIDEACKKVAPNYPMDVGSMHNTFLQALVGAGVLGFLASLAFAFLILKQIWVRLRSIEFYEHEDRKLIYVLSVGLLSLMIYSLFDNGPFFIHNVPNVLFWVYLGYFYYFTSKNIPKKKVV